MNIKCYTWKSASILPLWRDIYEATVVDQERKIDGKAVSP